MKYLILIFFLLPFSLMAQDESLVDVTEMVEKGPDPDKVFTFVDQQPEFPGGKEKMAKFLKKHFKTTAQAKAANVQGAVVVQFVVKKDGTISDPKIVFKKGYGLDEEALRVVNRFPKFEPARHNEKHVNFRYTLPLSFKNGEYTSER